MKISVITITYNNFDELVETLDSLKDALEENKIESLVINGGDCQKTKKYLESYPGKSISEPDEGISDAFNKGILNSSGDYIAVLNSGDLLIYKNYYRDALNIIEEKPNIPYVFGNAIFRHSYLGELSFKPSLDRILQQMPFAHCSMITSKKLLNRHGLFDKTYKIAMDYDFLIKTYKENIKGEYLDTSGAFLIDGTGVSSINGEMGIMECKRTLSREGLLTFSNFSYFFALKAKNKARKLLSFLGLINTYDRIRHGARRL